MNRKPPTPKHCQLGTSYLVREFVKAALRENSATRDLYRQVMDMTEQSLLYAVMDLMRWNQVQASEVLGIHRNTLRKRMRELGVTRDLSVRCGQ